MTEINNKKDIEVIINEFYDTVRRDDLIGPVFAKKIRDDDWERHLNRMYAFWNTVLFAKQDYRGNPFGKHASLPLEKEHFERWISLFKQAVVNNYAGEKADEIYMRAVKMGEMFHSKIQYLRTNPQLHNLI